MRAVVLTLILALVAGEPHRLAPDFSVGNQYVYKYDALLLAGLPEQGLARTGLKLASKVLIKAQAPNLYMMKLVEPEIYEHIGIWKKDPLVPVTKLIPDLTVPIKFEYAGGVVGKVFAPKEMSTTVMNIYRGIMNVLPLNIKMTQSVYELQEAGTQGVCKTSYAISEDVTAGHIQLTKTRDMNHCQERIVKDVGLAYTEKCDKCQQDSKNLRGEASYTYTLKQVPSGILIMGVTVHELNRYTPFTELNGATQMETKQSLKLLEVQRVPAERPLSNEPEYVQRGSLAYEFSDELLQMPVPLIKSDNARAQIVLTLKHLITHNVERVHEDAPLKFLELIQLLRVASYEDLETLWASYKNDPAYRQYILDSIPVIGTPVTFHFIKEKYLADEMTLAETVQAVAAAIHMVTANTETIKMVRALATDKKIEESSLLRKTFFLGYGTMVYKYCSEMPVCPDEHIKPIQDLLSHSVRNNDIENIILHLKVLGNAGHPASLKAITKTLPIYGSAAERLPMTVHVEAIKALRNIAKKQPMLVQELALQLYMDNNLHPELRMLACIVLFETRPPMGLVTATAKIVARGDNLQVASFTYSHMKSLARSTVPNHASLAAACNVATKLMLQRLDRRSLRHSRAIYMDTYNNPLMLGAAASAFSINDAATFLPKSVAAKFSAYFGGAAADLVEFGVRSEGLQEAFLRNPEIVDNADRLTKMQRVLKALARWKSQPKSKPLASVYMKFFGQEISFADFDEQLIERSIKLATEPPMKDYARNALKALLTTDKSWHLTKSLLANEVRRILPTAAGFPMELSLYTAAVAAATVQVKATTTPLLDDHFRLTDLLKTDMRLETEIRPSVAVNTFALMGINTKMLQAVLMTRAKLNSIVPAKVAAALSIKEGHFKFEALPVPVPEDVAAVQVETLAVVRNSENSAAAVRMTPVIPEHLFQPISREIASSADSAAKSSEILVQDEEVVRTKKVPKFEKKYRAKAVYVGLDTCLKIATINAAFIRDTGLYRMVGRHSAVLSVKPIEGEIVERLEMEIQVGPKAAEKLIKQINLSEEEIPGGRPVLMKLKRILKNNTSSSSSSSSSSRGSSSVSSISSSRASRKSSDRVGQTNKLCSSSSSSSSSHRSSSHKRSSISSSSSSRSGSSSSSSSSRSDSSSSSSSSSSSRSGSRSSSSRSGSRSGSSSSSVQSIRSTKRSRTSKKHSSSTSSSVSSASSIASLFSGSSSSSESSARLSKQMINVHKFRKNHKKQVHNSQVPSAALSRGNSSAASFEAIYRQNKFLGDKVAPTFAIIFRAVRADKKLQGYQLAAYVDKPTARVQVILAALAADNNWRLSADGILLSKHKARAKIAWRAECKQYDIMITAETGLVRERPAARFSATWDKLPAALKHYTKRVYKRISNIMQTPSIPMLGKKSANRLSLTAVVTSDRTIELISQMARYTISKQVVYLPVPLPLDEFSSVSVTDPTENLLYMLSMVDAAECRSFNDSLITFNNVRLRNKMPSSCDQIVAQDCTGELKFMVLLRKDDAGRVHLNVKIADIDIDFYTKNNLAVVMVNGREIAITNQQYKHATASVTITRKGESLSMRAPKLGVAEVYFDKKSWRIAIMNWMKRKTCGVCGKADGEIRQEYRTPGGQLTKDAVSYSHSWVLAASSCSDKTTCRVKHESVQLEKQVNLYGQRSKCFPVEPVLRCLSSCSPVKTTAVTVGFHCLPVDSSQTVRNLDQSSVDLTDTVEAHLACNCPAQCA